MLRPGDAWGEPSTREPDLRIVGSDADLASALTGGTGQLVSWTPSPDTDLGRAVGRAPGTAPETGLAAPMDRIASSVGPAVNAIVWGTPPNRLGWRTPMTRTEVVVDERVVWSGPATTVVMANGEFLEGRTLAPRAHPGDGLLDVVVLGLTRSERWEFRRRLDRGDHLEHPRVRVVRGRSARIVAGAARPVVVDGRGGAARADLQAHIESDSWAILL